jgi:hypothetical protein
MMILVDVAGGNRKKTARDRLWVCGLLTIGNTIDAPRVGIFDVIPETVDGKIVAYFFDPHVEAKLAELKTRRVGSSWNGSVQNDSD